MVRGTRDRYGRVVKTPIHPGSNMPTPGQDGCVIGSREGNGYPRRFVSRKPGAVRVRVRADARDGGAIEGEDTGDGCNGGTGDLRIGRNCKSRGGTGTSSNIRAWITRWINTPIPTGQVIYRMLI